MRITLAVIGVISSVNAGHAKTDRACLRIGRKTESGSAAAKHFRLGHQLGMHFQPNHHFISH